MAREDFEERLARMGQRPQPAIGQAAPPQRAPKASGGGRAKKWIWAVIGYLLGMGASILVVITGGLYDAVVVDETASREVESAFFGSVFLIMALAALGAICLLVLLIRTLMGKTSESLVYFICAMSIGYVVMKFLI